MDEKPKSKPNAMTHLTSARTALAAAYKMLSRMAVLLVRPS
jgi:hypothetical protein